MSVVIFVLIMLVMALSGICMFLYNRIQLLETGIIMIQYDVTQIAKEVGYVYLIMDNE